jgi:hypothetical protein
VVAVLVVRNLDPSGLPTASDAEPSASPSETPVPVSTPTADDEAALTAASVDGWKGIAVEDRGIAYDVPADWFALSPGVITGFEEEDPDAPFGYSPRVAMSGAAEFGAREEPCYDYAPSPGMAGTSGAGEAVDTAELSGFLAGEWASAAYDNDSGAAEVEVGATEPFTANGLEGHVTTATAAVAERPCYPEAARVTVATVLAPTGDDVYSLIVYTDTAGDQAVPEDTVAAITGSLRPL